MKFSEILTIALLIIIALELGYLAVQIRPRPGPEWPYDFAQPLPQIMEEGLKFPNPVEAKTLSQNIGYLKCAVALQLKLYEKMMMEKMAEKEGGE